TSGGDSVFDTLTAVGGGAGGGAGISGSPGGSGGGGGATNSTAVFSGGAGTAGQGNNGGYGQNRRGGGGGGAGSAGGNPVGTTGGDGGAGTTNTLFSLGPSFAGGGGGGASGTGYTGGSASGGGGAGGNDNAAGSPGTANTGGGGGGGSTSGGSGGSGIVIVRYLAPTMAIEVYNDVSLAIGPGISVPGEWQDTATDSTATMDWVSVVEPPSTANKITARITGGTLPTGLQLSVKRPSGGESITLSDTDQDFITNIGNESQTGQVLTYTLTVTDCATLFVTTETLTIEYTITAQP
ncbi:MAG: glycine-rich domain-containing protein, partial [Thermodesulfobacteriota bacterium]